MSKNKLCYKLCFSKWANKHIFFAYLQFFVKSNLIYISNLNNFFINQQICANAQILLGIKQKKYAYYLIPKNIVTQKYLSLLFRVYTNKTQFYGCEEHPGLTTEPANIRWGWGSIKKYQN